MRSWRTEETNSFISPKTSQFLKSNHPHEHAASWAFDEHADEKEVHDCFSVHVHGHTDRNCWMQMKAQHLCNNNVWD